MSRIAVRGNIVADILASLDRLHRLGPRISLPVLLQERPGGNSTLTAHHHVLEAAMGTVDAVTVGARSLGAIAAGVAFTELGAAHPVEELAWIATWVHFVWMQ